MRANLLFVSTGVSLLLLPLFVMACTSSSNAVSTTDGGNPAACPAAAPIGVPSCSRNADGGAFACSYPCGDGQTGSIDWTCDGSQWHAESETCAAVQPGPTGPIACGNTTCADGQSCVHECCDITPCTPPSDDGGCLPGSHPVPENGGECQNGCIENDPECLPSYQCEAPPQGCGRYCSFDCD